MMLLSKPLSLLLWHQQQPTPPGASAPEQCALHTLHTAAAAGMSTRCPAVRQAHDCAATGEADDTSHCVHTHGTAPPLNHAVQLTRSINASVFSLLAHLKFNFLLLHFI